MKRTVIIGWLCASLALPVASGAAHRASHPHTRKRRHYPLTLAGITAGSTPDARVRQLYGRGFYVADEDHAGGRYFIDPKRGVTLHVTMGPDWIVDDVSYEQGVHLPDGQRRAAKAIAAAISRRLTTHERVQDGIRLGDSETDVLRKLGRPARDTRRRSVRTLRYEANESNMPGVLFYEAEFRFQHHRLVSVDLYNGE